MGNLILAFDTVGAAALATVCGWAVMSPRVRDGVIIKLGLIMMSLGAALVSLALADGVDAADPFLSAGTLFLVGNLVVMAGAAWRVAGKPRKRRRVTDWADLDDSRLAR